MSSGISIFYVLSLLVGIALAIVVSAACLVIATALVVAVIKALITVGDCLLERLAPTSPLPRATASFHHGDHT